MERQAITQPVETEVATEKPRLMEKKRKASSEVIFTKKSVTGSSKKLRMNAEGEGDDEVSDSETLEFEMDAVIMNELSIEMAKEGEIEVDEADPSLTVEMMHMLAKEVVRDAEKEEEEEDDDKEDDDTDDEVAAAAAAAAEEEEEDDDDDDDEEEEEEENNDAAFDGSDAEQEDDMDGEIIAVSNKDPIVDEPSETEESKVIVTPPPKQYDYSKEYVDGRGGVSSVAKVASSGKVLVVIPPPPPQLATQLDEHRLVRDEHRDEALKVWRVGDDGARAPPVAESAEVAAAADPSCCASRCTLS